MMSRSLNKVQLIGNVGLEPEIRFTQDGRPIASFSIATTDNWKDKQGQKQERTEWHRVVVFGKLAEIIQQYVHKGSKLFLEGKLQTRKWTDNQGVDKYTTEVVINPFEGQMIMLDGGGRSQTEEGGYQQPASSGYGGQPQQRGYSQPAASSPQPAAQPHQADAPAPDFDDDIPF
ncbi:MAG: single-stranded DNA-binding protein [Magnetococcales bacterium]|nr:single-stranded DNA-binding protein [Magnetococcales bacterium]